MPFRKLIDPLKRLLERREQPQQQETAWLPPEVLDPMGEMAHEYYAESVIWGVDRGPDGVTSGAYAIADGRSGDPHRYPLPQNPSNPKSVFFPNGTRGIVKAIGDVSVLLATDTGLWHIRKDDVRSEKPRDLRRIPASIRVRAGSVVVSASEKE